MTIDNKTSNSQYKGLETFFPSLSENDSTVPAKTSITTILIQRRSDNSDTWICNSTLNLYMDGSKVATDTTNAGVIPDNTGNSPVRMGANSLSEEGNIIGGFKGQLDDITIWNVAGTDNQILDLFNKESKNSR